VLGIDSKALKQHKSVAVLLSTCATTREGLPNLNSEQEKKEGLAVEGI